jgi:transcriptional regulator with XRE-family HTH domain
MAPRKVKSKPLSDSIAANIKRHRDRQAWSQEQLAEEMRATGYDSWGRTTVTEVEGKGRRRQVSVAELLGLAQVFGTGVDELLWDANDLPLEVSETHVLLERKDLQEMLIRPDVMAEAAMQIVGPALEKQIRKLYDTYLERVQFIAKELRDTAGYFEDDAIKRLQAIGEQS